MHSMEILFLEKLIALFKRSNKESFTEMTIKNHWIKMVLISKKAK